MNSFLFEVKENDETQIPRGQFKSNRPPRWLTQKTDGMTLLSHSVVSSGKEEPLGADH